MTVDALCKCNNIQHDIWRKQNMGVFHSMLKPDCLTRGIISATWATATTPPIMWKVAVREHGKLSCSAEKLVYDEEKYTLDEMKEAILANFGFKTAEEIGSYSLGLQRRKLAVKSSMKFIATA